MRAQECGGEGWGFDASQEMLGLSRWVYPESGAALARGVAESLPFRDASFDRIVCQGSLDHFVYPRHFMREAARLLCPDGRLVIGLTNYESLSCRLARFGRRWLTLLRQPRPAHRLYWETPEDHFHKGDVAFVRALGGDGLQLERCYGLSMLWLLPGWDSVLEKLPARAREALLTGLDRAARGRPGLSDMIVSVWRRRA
jgi:SAM-dependent methyltransferase